MRDGLRPCAVAASVRVRKRLAPALPCGTYPLPSRLACSPATTQLVFPVGVAFGAAHGCGCAATQLLTLPLELIFDFLQDEQLRQVPLLLPNIVTVSPVPVSNLWAPLRDRAALPSPLRGLVPSGGHPSPLRSLCSLRIPCPAVRSAHRRLPGRRCLALLRRCGTSTFVYLLPALRAALVSGSAVAHPIISPALVVANAAPVLPHRASPAQAPRRLLSGSLPEPISPSLGTPDQALSTHVGAANSHPTHLGCNVLARTPKPHYATLEPLRVRSTMMGTWSLVGATIRLNSPHSKSALNLLNLLAF